MFDLAINNGQIVDPYSNTNNVLNLGINDGKIIYKGKRELPAKKVIDASRLIVSPGFIDIHTHEDSIIFSDYPNTPLPLQTSQALLKTGVTTMVGGNCGISPYPLDSYMDRINKNNMSINYLMLIGYNTLRKIVGVNKYKKATKKDIEIIKEMVTKGLCQGAMGVSFGLQYAPGITLKEVKEIAKIVKQKSKFIAVHLRYDYPAKAMDALMEIIMVARETGVRVEISHISANIYGRKNMDKALDLLDKYNLKGYKIKADTYPYTVWATSIKSTVFDPSYFKKLKFSLEDIEILTGQYSGQRCNKELFQKLRNNKNDTLVACHNAVPGEDIEKAINNQWVIIGSDGQLIKDKNTGEIKGHPRSSGTPARILGKFVREKELLSLEEAINKLSCEPARRLQLKNKGKIEKGKDADITIFDRNRIIDQGKFGINVCGRAPTGINYVINEGKIIYQT